MWLHSFSNILFVNTLAREREKKKIWFKSLHRLEFYSVLQPDPFKLENAKWL